MFIENWFQYFNPRIPIWQSYPPTDVGKGLEIGIYARYYNSDSVIRAMTAHITIRNPNGTVIASVSPDPVNVYMGGNSGNIITTKSGTNKVGSYTATVTLYADGEQIDTWQGIIATVGAAEITGIIYPERFYYWDDAIGDWQDNPPEGVKVNGIGIQADGRNTGTDVQYMSIEIKIKDPAGTIIETANSGVHIVPVNGFVKVAATAQVTTNGTYTADITLFSNSQILDSWSGDIAINVEKDEPTEKYIKIATVDVIPSKPIPGDTVYVKVGVQNKVGKPIYVRVVAFHGGQKVIFNPDQLLVGISATRYFDYTFKMPDEGVSFSIYSQYLTTDNEWYDDDLVNIVITPYGGNGNNNGNGTGGIPWWVWVAGGTVLTIAAIVAIKGR